MINIAGDYRRLREIEGDRISSDLELSHTRTEPYTIYTLNDRIYHLNHVETCLRSSVFKLKMSKIQFTQRWRTLTIAEARTYGKL